MGMQIDVHLHLHAHRSANFGLIKLSGGIFSKGMHIVSQGYRLLFVHNCLQLEMHKGP